MTSPSLRARLAIWCVAVVVAVVASFATVVLVTQRQMAILRIDRGLAETHQQVAKMLREELEELDSPAIAAHETLEILASPERPIAILDGGGAVLARRFDGPALADVFAGGGPAALTGTIATGGVSWRVQATRETLRGIPFVVVVAIGLEDVARDQQNLREAILLGMPIALLLAAAGGLWLATSGLRPSPRWRARRRLPLSGAEDLGRPTRQDEVGQLTAAFNALLARLRAALQTQRQFMADASHELRIRSRSSAPPPTSPWAAITARNTSTARRSPSRRRRPAASARWSTTCWCWPGPTPAAIRSAASISSSTTWSTSACARSACWPRRGASPSPPPAPPRSCSMPTPS
jgi:hypothetical protein